MQHNISTDDDAFVTVLSRVNSVQRETGTILGEDFSPSRQQWKWLCAFNMC